jgi:acetolactate synthase-1/2/3 large subunit
MPRKQRVVDHIVEHLASVGVDHIFGVDGANIEDLYDAAHFRSDITGVLAKHEFSAAAMADAGIGMAFGRTNSGRPGGRTVVIAGDGAFFMHGMEVHTAVHYQLPVTFVLFNNNAHAMCVTREQLFYDDLYSYNRFRPSRLGAGLAAMFPGLNSVDVTDLDGFAAAMRAALDVDGPAVVSVECAADEIPLFAPFLAEPSKPSKLSKEGNRIDVAAGA